MSLQALLVYPRRDACTPPCHHKESSRAFAVTTREQANVLADSALAQIFPTALPSPPGAHSWIRKHCTKHWVRRGLWSLPQRRAAEPGWV